MQKTATITICVWKLKLLRMETLVADPDTVFLGHPDPGKTGFGSFIHKETHVILVFSLYKIV